MADLIVKSAVKEQFDGMSVAADFYDAFDEDVDELLEDAARRAETNDRKTVQPPDLQVPTLPTVIMRYAHVPFWGVCSKRRRCEWWTRRTLLDRQTTNPQQTFVAAQS